MLFTICFFRNAARIRLQRIIDHSYEQIKGRCAEATSLSELVTVIEDVSIRQNLGLMPVWWRQWLRAGAPLQILMRLQRR